MFSKTVRTIYFSLCQKLSHRDYSKYKCSSHPSRVHSKKFVLIGPVLFLIWWWLLPTPIIRSLAEIEMEVERLLRENRKGSLAKSDLAQEDPAVVGFVREYYISKPGRPTKIDLEKDESLFSEPHLGLAQYLLEEKLISSKDPGYFVEVGSHDGTGFTSTLSIDRVLGWSGLVVEPVATLFRKMSQAREMHRNKDAQNEIILSRATISPQPYLTMSNFDCHPTADSWGRLYYKYYKTSISSTVVLCIPLYSLLLAAGVPERVDLLILDIGGSELNVLETLPFENIQISIVVVETYNGKDGPTSVQDFLQGKGYKIAGKVRVPFGKGLVRKMAQIIERDDVLSEYTIFKRGE